MLRKRKVGSEGSKCRKDSMSDHQATLVSAYELQVVITIALKEHI